VAKKRPVAGKTAKSAKAPKQAKAEPHEQEIALSDNAFKALKLIEKSAKVRTQLEEAVTLAVDKAVQKCMKDNKLALTLLEANVLAGLWFGEADEHE
jgi:hypothetical protein